MPRHLAHRLSRLAVLALAAPLALSACGDGDADGGGQASSGESAQGDSPAPEDEGPEKTDGGSGAGSGGVESVVAGAADDEWVERAKAARDQTPEGGQFCLDLPPEALDHVAHMVPEPRDATAAWVVNASQVSCEFEAELTSEWTAEVTISHAWDGEHEFTECQAEQRAEDMEPFGDQGVVVETPDLGDSFESADAYLCDEEGKAELGVEVLLHDPEDMPEGGREAGPLAGSLADALAGSWSEWGPEWEAFWEKQQAAEG